MISFLFEQYGYYPKSIVNGEFVVDEWLFKLMEVDLQENILEVYDDYLFSIRNIFEGKGAFIIKNREGKMISFFDNKKYVLVCSRLDKLSLQDLNKMHCSLMEKEKNIDLKVLLKTWQEKISFIESDMVKLLKVDSVHYKNNMEITLFCLGMAQNSIQYLSEVILDYGDFLGDLCVCHKRLKNLDSFDMFNPLNMIVDHPVRDLCELYKNDVILFSQFIDVLKYYHINTKVASVLIARLLYPSSVFDQLEDLVDNRSFDKLFFNIEKEFEKIKKIYLYLKKEYNLRPVIWLEN